MISCLKIAISSCNQNPPFDIGRGPPLLSEIRRRKGPPPRPPGPPGPCNAGGIEGDLAAAVRADNGVG